MVKVKDYKKLAEKISFFKEKKNKLHLIKFRLDTTNFFFNNLLFLLQLHKFFLNAFLQRAKIKYKQENTMWFYLVCHCLLILIAFPTS